MSGSETIHTETGFQKIEYNEYISCDNCSNVLYEYQSDQNCKFCGSSQFSTVSKIFVDYIHLTEDYGQTNFSDIIQYLHTKADLYESMISNGWEFLRCTDENRIEMYKGKNPEKLSYHIKHK